MLTYLVKHNASAVSSWFFIMPWYLTGGAGPFMLRHDSTTDKIYLVGLSCAVSSLSRVLCHPRNENDTLYSSFGKRAASWILPMLSIYSLDF